MKQLKKLIMTLVALFAMTTGAWAQATPLITIESTGDNASFNSGSKTFDDIATVTFSGNVGNDDDSWGWYTYSESGITLTVTAAEGYTITRVKFYNNSGSAFVEEAPFEAILVYDNGVVTKVNGTSLGKLGVTKIEVYGYAGTEPPLEVTWDAATKTGTFTQPASDVVLTPIYAPVAQWATENEVALLPTAAEGIFAGTTDPIIVEGTVAPEQGTVMYAVTTDDTTAPTLAAFSATVPTAENIADEGATVYVWYYIQGAATPDGQEATAENTFNDSEICATPLEVSVLSNQFDITFNAANANTIEAGKATVTVGGTAATVTEGKLEAVKMGSEVKMTAKQGYKFRKVEAKKAPATGHALSASEVGEIVCSDGLAYAAADKDNLPQGVTAVAMVAYKSETAGSSLALALTDEGIMTWNNSAPSNNGKTAPELCSALNTSKAVTGGTWKLPSKDEWKQMFSANGGNEGSYTGLNTALGNAGGTALLENEEYWSSSEDNDNASSAWLMYLANGNASWNTYGKHYARYVRACLAF